MRGYSYDECGCRGERYHGHRGNYGPGWGYNQYGPRWRCFEGLSPEERKEYLQEEKKILEKRLKDVEDEMAEPSTKIADAGE